MYDQDADPEDAAFEGELFVLLEIVSHTGQVLWSRVVDLKVEEIAVLREQWLEDLSAMLGRRYDLGGPRA